MKLKQIFKNKVFRALAYIYHVFFENDCANRAASLSYSTLLTLVPLIIVGFWILSLFPAFSGTGSALQQFVINNFVAHSAEIISDQLSHFLEQTKKLSVSNLLALALISVLLIYDMASAFNNIWKIKIRQHFALSFVFYSIVLVLAPIFFALTMVVGVYLVHLPFLEEVSYLGKPLFIILPYLVAFFVFTLFNWVLPTGQVPLRYAIAAGFITMILFEIVKFLFGMYMSYFPTYRLIYGALASIPIFLLWIYTSWVIILLGAVICFTLTRGVPADFTPNQT
jgi:membrane protein